MADHVQPHRGDYELFWSGALQSLCKPHHDAAKQQIETRGYHDITDEAGYPLDARHPANRSRGTKPPAKPPTDDDPDDPA